MSRLSTALSAVFGAPKHSRDLASNEIGWRYRYDRGSGSTPRVTAETALRHSAVWACLRLRADLISTMPIDVFRPRDGRMIEVTKPPLLVEPYPDVDITEHLYSSQIDLDRYGNSVGIVRARNALGQPAMIQLAPMSETSAVIKDWEIREWRICGKSYTPAEVWHEKQWTVGGLPIGLSPIAYAAWTIGGYLSAQQFALDWFNSGAQPSGVLRNTEMAIISDVADSAKTRFKAATQNRDIFVTGKDWEWNPSGGDASATQFLEAQQAGVLDVCRYLAVPGDMIDASTATGSITYANVTQRNVQLLVMNLGPALLRRERVWSRRALPAPRVMKFNTDAVLRMDPESRERVILSRVKGRTLAPSEARALDNLAPFTPDQVAEFEALGLNKSTKSEDTSSSLEIPA